MLIATLITSCALSIPWDPATSKTMNGQYGFANPLPGAGKKPTHRGTDYFEVTNFFVFFAQNLYLPSTFFCDSTLFPDRRDKRN